MAFIDCVWELADCRDSNQRHLCRASLPPQLGTMMTRRAWCSRAVREAAADMQALKQTGRQGGEVGNYTMGGQDRGNFTCTGSKSSCCLLNCVQHLLVLKDWSVLECPPNSE